MIGILDSFVLARTKLQSKKILLIVTVFLASLIFGIIIAGITVVTGAMNSANNYLTSSLNNRYLVDVTPVVPDAVYGTVSKNTVPSDSLKKTLLALQDQYTAQQETLAKQYGVTFDSSSIEPIIQPSPFGIKDSLGQLQQVINTDSPVWQLYVTQLQQQWIKKADNTQSDLKIAAKSDGATAYYHNLYSSLNYTNAQYLKEGIENISQFGQTPTDYNATNPAVTSVRNSSYVFTDQSLVQRYILPENAKRKQNHAAIPVVITTDEAIALFGDQLAIGKQPSSASAQIAWMKELQDKINGQTYQVCYRSIGQISLIQQTMQQNVNAETKSNSYTSPSLTYNLPSTSCGGLAVKTDTRTASEKLADANQEAYQKANGTYQPIVSQLLTFQVVGVMSISPTTNTYTSVSSFVNGLLSVNYMNGAFIPSQLYNQLPDQYQYKSILQGTGQGVYDDSIFTNGGVQETIVAFPTAKKAQDFINKYTCFTVDSNGCSKPWTSQIYGANYLLINDLASKITSIARIGLPVALALAGIIIWITMARVIIDSRHETAVFRALGARRSDIMSIYIEYSLMISVLIVICALILGSIGAGVVEILYGTQATNYAKVAYGAFDQLQPFSFIGINLSLIVLVLVLIIVVSLLAVLPPLIRNVRRSPVRDMREDG